MLEIKQFREVLVRPCLEDLKAWSESAEELMVLTCAAETLGGTYLKQVKGPALGIYSCEPETHNDIWRTFMFRNHHLIRPILHGCNLIQTPTSEYLTYNLKYATYMARVFYMRFKEPLPAADDINGLAAYWKKYYNTSLGKGKIEDAVKKYHLFARTKKKR